MLSHLPPLGRLTAGSGASIVAMPLHLHRKDRVMTNSASDTPGFPAGSAPRNDPADAARIASTAITLLNYIDVLQEHLQEAPYPHAESRHDESPGPSLARLSAMHALRSIKMLLQRAGYGRPVDRNEFRSTLHDAHAKFMQAGLIPSETTPPFDLPRAKAQRADAGNQTWSPPQWAIMKLYEGITNLVRDASSPSGVSSQTQSGA